MTTYSKTLKSEKKIALNKMKVNDSEMCIQDEKFTSPMI